MSLFFQVLKKWFDLHVDRCKRKLEAAEHYSMSSQMDNLINVQVCNKLKLFKTITFCRKD